MDAHINQNINIFFNNNNITGRSYGIYMDVYNNNNTNVTFEDNNIKEADNGVSMDASNNNNTNMTFENNNISGIYGYAALLGLDYGNNTKVLFSCINLTGAEWGIWLGVSNSNNTNITFENNSLIGTSEYGIALTSYSNNNITIFFGNNNINGIFGLGLLLATYDNNNSNITFLKNNITGEFYGVFVYSSESNLCGFNFFNNKINSTKGDGFYFFSNEGDLPTDVTDFIIRGNSIFAPNGAGLNFTGLYVGSFVNVTVEYNHVLALVGVNITGFNDNSSFDYNWWGFNDISSLIFGIDTNNHYILNITNLTSLNNLKIGDSVKFMFLVLNNTLTNDGVDQLPYFVINGTFNGQEFSVNNTSNFTGEFNIDNVGVQLIDGTLDNQNVNFEFSANKVVTNSSIIVSNATFGENVAIYGQLANYAGINFVNVTVDGVNYAVPVNTTGGWNLTYFTNHTGDIPVVVSFAGNDNFNAFSNFKNFNVVKLATNSSIIILNATAGKTTIIRGVFVDKNGKPINKASLNVIIGGKSYNVFTSTNGNWNLSYTPSKEGKFIAEVKYSGNSNYLGFTNTMNYTVSKGSDVPTKPDVRLVKKKYSKAIRYGNIVYMKWLTFKNYGYSGSDIVNAHVIYKNLKYNLWKVYNKKIKYKYVDNKIKFKINLKSGKTFKIKIKVYRPIR
ncbi:hypothetical protein SDC9_33940 [bioreactor metagenome]|uniref:Right handed beta helix domain-containing protein n=1 Tax=bioreactor metagenome TaxID=1076179 RepID=A0A644V9P4_9ZZZZ|nr:right-handed parallel beta-helix repeat-containing protein [Methanobrevibacter sp.]MEA4957765.1 right-handed parallel beta-helix repeat-containing protein [Methanobrevibacter sp.]